MSLINLILTLMLAFAHGAVLDPSQGTTTFLAIGRPSAIKINGKGAGPSGDLALKRSGGEYLLNGELKLEIGSLQTGIEMRDQHMKEKYLEAGKFKEAILRLADARIPEKVLRDGGEAVISGILSLHGVEKSVDTTLTILPQAPSIKGTSRFKLKLSDYNIEIPRFAGITVADEVEVTTEVSLPAAALNEAI